MISTLASSKTRNLGYTLLELIIVLVLMGLLMGLTTPRLMQLYESVSFSLQRDEILFQLESLPFALFQRGEAFKLSQLSEEPASDLITLPEGWAFDPVYADDVTYSPFGYCSGGEARFTKGDREVRLKLTAPLCQPKVM
ncbi:prepilin-type N-terminal cleavage/methylation domain-containing protein [Aestuariibacter sp. A3R04]|uniref:prepilin-type N-terminal cleavage/methylation domain-containing protein n=1 Tax=Aestuariibacter sp. A3R04 TaxID=2841571 RepID=UPI001C094EC9|nr:prepilin-type N-terminal cleavage/methylation domain-containing protein [Aestuariibacter sp. A3R04]MBU3023398.1 prepilin-type N-terminal cleavage/methylation domain-containing protein [Aestuariibacter sp. A3R04]